MEQKMFITVFTIARHLVPILSQMNPVHAPYIISSSRSILISSHPHLVFHQNPCTHFSPPHAPHSPPTSLFLMWSEVHSNKVRAAELGIIRASSWLDEGVLSFLGRTLRPGVTAVRDKTHSNSGFMNRMGDLLCATFLLLLTYFSPNSPIFGFTAVTGYRLRLYTEFAKLQIRP
jgi:hypothetical protein